MRISYDFRTSSVFETRARFDIDSVNTNPDLVHVYSQNNGEMVAMTWEKSTNDSSTAIYYRDLLDPDSEQAVISVPGVHFKNPKILNQLQLNN